MCRLVWSFAAHICDEYLNHMNWYKQLGLILHYIPCFRAISEGSGETAQMFSLPDHLLLEYVICFMNWP